MISHSLAWLEQYKDQIGILIQIGLLIATAVLIRVGFKQATAASAQAKAADAQVVAAAAQSDTAKNQLNLAVKQLYAGLASNDAATRPLLQFITLEPRIIDSTDLSIRVRNCGLGPALDMEAFYGDDPSEAAGLHGEFLGVGDEKVEKFDKIQMLKSCLTVRYSSTHGSKYETKLHFDPEDQGYLCQFHTRVFDAFAQINENE